MTCRGLICAVISLFTSIAPYFTHHISSLHFFLHFQQIHIFKKIPSLFISFHESKPLSSLRFSTCLKGCFFSWQFCFITLDDISALWWTLSSKAPQSLFQGGMSQSQKKGIERFTSKPEGLSFYSHTVRVDAITVQMKYRLPLNLV